MSADRMPISRGIAPLADIPDREGGDGGPELVIRGEHPWLVSSRQAVPMLPRRRHEIGQPVQEVTRREFDDDVSTRPRRLPPTPRAYPVGRLVSGEHVADAGDAAVFAADHGEPLQREGRPGTVSQKMLETFKVARHVAVDERDPDACVSATEVKLFLDLRAATSSWTKWNEEGLLGLAFHPRFEENGEFFVCQSVQGDKRMEHITRFRVSPDAGGR
jgi:hypothetical protein